MTFNKDKWVKAIQKSVQDQKGLGPTSANICILATLRYIRDEFADDVGGPGAAEAVALKESLAELWAQVKDAKDFGFANTASAAAKAAGFKGESVEAIAVDF